MLSLHFHTAQMALIMLQNDSDNDSEHPDMRAAKRYFSGDDDEGWQGHPPKGSSVDDTSTEGVSSSTIVSGLVASRKQDHAVGQDLGSSH